MKRKYYYKRNEEILVEICPHFIVNKMIGSLSCYSCTFNKGIDKEEHWVKCEKTSLKEVKFKHLTDEHIGLCFTAEISGSECEGRINKECENWYLCQNRHDGEECIDKLGYTYSWIIYSGSEKDLSYNCVKNLKLFKLKIK
jgi:hypothetical protein